MTDVANLRFNVDTSGLKRGQKEVSRLGSESNNTTKSITGMGRSLLKVAGLTGGVLAIRQQFRAITDEAQLFERQMLRTEAVISATGATAGFSADQLREQARQLAFATLESTEGIMQAQQVLLTFRSVSGDVFTRATELAQDLATVTGTSLTGSMTQLGKALEDPVQGITALRRSGVSFTDAQKDMIASLQESGDLLGAQNIILDELAQQYGGVARAEALGLAGAQDTLGQSVQELRLAIEGYLGTGDRLAAFYNRISEGLQDFTAIIASGQIQHYLQAISNEFEYLANDVRMAMDFVSMLVEDAAQFWGQSGTDGVGFIIDAFKDIVPNLKTAVQLATVELIVLADRAMVYGKAIGQSLNPKNWIGGDFSFADFIKDETSRIDAARFSSINSIIQERDAAKEATSERRRVILDGGREVREEWELQQRTLSDTAFVANETARIIQGGMESGASAARDFSSDLNSLRSALGTEMGNAASQYLMRLELIAEAEASAALSSEEAQDLRLRSFEHYQERMTDITDAQARERERIAQRESDMRLAMQEAEVRAMQGFFGNLAQVAAAGGKESFEAYKALATVEAGIAGALAYTKALASAPPPFNFALAGSVAALTAVQMATIQSQTYKQRAMGGQVQAGDSVLVGERGPELLTMGGSGNVTPSHRLGGGDVSVTNVFQVSTGVAETVQAEIAGMVPMFNEMSKQAVMQAVGQGGAMSKAMGKRR